MPSTSMPWIKLYTEMLDDPKIGKLPLALRWRFVEMLLIAGECDADGYLTGMNANDIAWRLRTGCEEIQNDLELLAKNGLMQLDGDIWLVVNFAKRQGRSQSVKRQQWHEAQNKRRDAQNDNQDTDGGNIVICDTDMTPNVIITPEKRREDQDQEERRSISAQAPKPTKGRKTSDPRSKHPAILCALGVARHYPPLEIYDDVIRILGEHPDGAKLAECRREWVKRGYNSNGWGWALDWYKTGIPARNGSAPAAHQRKTALNPGERPPFWTPEDRAAGRMNAQPVQEANELDNRF